MLYLPIVTSSTLNDRCSCKGIRKCAICAPSTINETIDSQVCDKIRYIYCLKCSICHLIDDNEDELKLLNRNDLHINCVLNGKSNGGEINSKDLIRGVNLIPNFLTENEEEYLISEINQVKWIASQSGRFKQDYGPKVNFKKKKVKLNTFIGLPIYSKLLVKKLLSKDAPINVLNNFIPIELCNLKYENERGASIDPHYDDIWLWGERLVTINLLSDTYLTMVPSSEIANAVNIDENSEVLIPLKRHSMIILTRDARFKWMHAVKSKHIQQNRVAITLRELTEDFKTGLSADVGKYLEQIAFSYKGISTGELEDRLKDENEDGNVNSSLDVSLSNSMAIGDAELETALISALKKVYQNILDMNEIKLEHQKGYSDKTYKLSINGRLNFILKVFNKNANATKINYIAQFKQHLAFNSIDHIVIAKLMVSEDRKLVNELSNPGVICWIQEYMNGTQLSEMPLDWFYKDNHEVFVSVGQMVAKWRLMSSQVANFI